MADLTRGDILLRVRGLCTFDEQRYGFVYFLCDMMGECVYVGQALSLRHRIKGHRDERTKSFGMVYAVRVPLYLLNAVEGVFICLLKPKYNLSRPSFDRTAVSYVATTFFAGDAELLWSLFATEPREGHSPNCRRTHLDVPDVEDARRTADVGDVQRKAVKMDMILLLSKAWDARRRRERKLEGKPRRRKATRNRRTAATGGGR